MVDDVIIPRSIPGGLHASPDDFGYGMVEAAVARMTTVTHDNVANLTGVSFALFGPAGIGKSAVAASLVSKVRARCKWLTAMQCIWVQASWVGAFCSPMAWSDVDQQLVNSVLTSCRLLAVDGVGEESERGRDRVVSVIKTRIDAGRPTVVTSRLPLDGSASSLASLYPHVRRSLDRRFIYATPSPRT